MSFRDESSRCLHCKNPLCKVGCPVGYDIPEFLYSVKNGEYSKATATVGHLFGEICGYICPREVQCKGNCVLNRRGAPVDVGDVERQVFAENFPKLARQSDELFHKKISVVGGGVSGVTFASALYKLGADVTVFERAELLHTLKSIPEFRLPRGSLQRVIRAVDESGINVVKQDVSATFLKQLCECSDAVYLATGVMTPHKMNVVGEQFATAADDFLRGDAFGEAIVVGGGNTAMDCARLNARNGFPTTVAYRRTRADMPAFAKEICEAENENVNFRFNVAPVSVEKRGEKLAVTFAETISEGRGKLVLTNNSVTIECKILVLALGNGFDNSLLDTEKFVPVQNYRVFGKLFAGGDAIGHSLAAQAVSDGLRAADSATSWLLQQ